VHIRNNNPRMNMEEQMHSNNHRKAVRPSGFDRAAWFVVPSAVAITLACYTGNFQQMRRAAVAEQVTSDHHQPLGSDDAVKAGRPTQAAQTIEDTPIYALASAQQTDFLVAHRADAVIATEPNIPEAVPAPESKPATGAARAPSHERPTENPKHLLPPSPNAPAPAAQSNVLDDSQISGLRGRLRLTSDQIEYWPAVESALREIVRTQLRGTKSGPGSKLNIDINSPGVQKLIWAAMPLLMRLRGDQKSEIRRLARVIGLDQVASQI
jgi:hypothetical protein